jgi:Uma2 family endonuclease
MPMTAEELFATYDNDRIDRRLIRGRLVERSYPFRCPAHSGVVAKLSGILGNWQRSEAGTSWSVYGYGCPYRLQSDPDTVLYFDASIIPAALDRATPARAPFIDGAPALAVEVIDLSDPPDAIGELVDVGLSCGVPLLWLIDPVEETVTVHQLGARKVVMRIRDEIVADSVGPSLRFPVAEIFE